MTRTTLLAVFACVCVYASTSAREQPPADCKPNPLNIPGAPYPCVYPDGRAMFRVVAPDAQKVRVRLGPGFDMSKGQDGLWYVTTTPLVVGFHYYTLAIDGAVVADPATRTFFGSGFYNSAIEVPEPVAESDYYTPEGRAARTGAPAAGISQKSLARGAVATSTPRLDTMPIPERNIRFCTCYTGGERTSRAGMFRATSTSSWTT